MRQVSRDKGGTWSGPPSQPACRGGWHRKIGACAWNASQTPSKELLGGDVLGCRLRTLLPATGVILALPAKSEIPGRGGGGRRKSITEWKTSQDRLSFTIEETTMTGSQRFKKPAEIGRGSSSSL